MAYQVNDFKSKDRLYASQLNRMDAQIAKIDDGFEHAIFGVPSANHRVEPVVWENGTIIDETGADTGSQANGRTGFIPINGENVVAKVRSIDLSSTNWTAYRTFYYDENKTYIGRTGYAELYNSTPISEKAPAGTAYFRLKLYHPGIYEIHIEYGDQACIGINEKVNNIRNESPRSFSLLPRGNGNKPVVTILDDDGHNEFHDVYMPYLERGIPVASAIDPIHWTGNNARFMDWDKIHELKSMGCEFLLHGYDTWRFPNSAYPTEESLREYFEEAQKVFIEHGLTGYDIAVYPQGDVHADLRRVCRDYFRASFNVIPVNGKYYINPPITTYNLARYPWHDHTLDETKALIDEVYEQNAWLVLYGHSYAFNDSRKQLFSQIIDYVQEKGIELVTNQEALNRFCNAYEIGDYYSVSTTSKCTAIGCDGSVFQYPERSSVLLPNGTDDTAALQEALDATGVALLGEGTYNVSTITMPDNSIIRGLSRKTILKTVGDVDAIHCGKACTVEDVEIVGAVNAKQTTLGVASGIVITSSGVQNTKISRCTIHGFTRYGLYLYETGDATQDSATVSDCEIYHCYAGIYTRKSEYNRFIGCISRYNYFGVKNLGGNNTFTGCTFGKNDVGFGFSISNEVIGNVGHGMCTNCTFNHCDIYGILFANMQNNGFMFSSCQIWYSKVKIISTKGILFDCCTFGNSAVFDVDADSSAMVNDSMFSTAPAENASIKMSNCTLISGIPVGSSDDGGTYATVENLSAGLSVSKLISSHSYHTFRIGKQVTICWTGGATADIAHNTEMIGKLPKPNRDVYGFFFGITTKEIYIMKIGTDGVLKNFSGKNIPNGEALSSNITYVCE